MGQWNGVIDFRRLDTYVCLSVSPRHVWVLFWVHLFNFLPVISPSIHPSSHLSFNLSICVFYLFRSVQQSRKSNLYLYRFPLFVFLSGLSVPFLLPDLVVGVIFQSFPLFLVHIICFNCNLRLSTYLTSSFLAVPFLVHLSPVPICQPGWLCGCLSVCPFVLVSLRLCACLSAFVFHFLVFCFFNCLLIGPFVMSTSLSHICCLFCLFDYLFIYLFIYIYLSIFLLISFSA